MDQDLEAKVGQRLEDSEKNLGWKIALGVGGKGWGGGQWSALTTPTRYSVSFSCMGTLGGGQDPAVTVAWFTAHSAELQTVPGTQQDLNVATE